MPVGQELAQQQNHHYGCGHIIEHSREEEGSDAEHPQKHIFLAGLDVIGDDREAAVDIHKLYDSHRAD